MVDQQNHTVMYNANRRSGITPNSFAERAASIIEIIHTPNPIN